MSKEQEITRRAFFKKSLRTGLAVGAAADEIPFEEKMAERSAKLVEQFAEADQLEATTRKNLEVLGYGVPS